MSVDDDRSLGHLIGEIDPRLESAGEWTEANAILNRLDERLRTIVTLRFFEGLTQQEIAEIVGVSQVHVSRLLKEAFESCSHRSRRRMIGDRGPLESW